MVEECPLLIGQGEMFSKNSLSAAVIKNGTIDNRLHSGGWNSGHDWHLGSMDHKRCMGICNSVPTAQVGYYRN